MDSPNNTENIIIDSETTDEFDALDPTRGRQYILENYFNPEMLIPEGDGDDYSPIDDGSWLDR
jgi:hypothetical protein